MYISGQLPINSETGNIPETIEAQVKQSMENVLSILESAGSNPDNILKCGLFVNDMSLFERINDVYREFFTEGEPPARFVVEVSRLPKDAKIEIDAIALI